MPDTGSKSKYKDEYVEQARMLCEQFGAIDDDLAAFFKVKVRTIHRWKAQHPEFLQALTIGKEVSDNRVERALYMRAVGFKIPALKWFSYEGKSWSEEYEEYIPGDTRAQIFFLCNRRKDRWSNSHMKGIGAPGDDDIPDAVRVDVVDGRANTH